MPKDRYFLSNDDYTEPFGQVIKKGSVLKYISQHDSQSYYVLYFDREENSVYPIIFYKSKLTNINTSDVDKAVRKLFDDSKNEKHEKTLAEMFPKREDQIKYIMDIMEKNEVIKKRRERESKKKEEFMTRE